MIRLEMKRGWFADHVMNDITDNGTRIWAYDPAINRMVRLDAFDLYQHSAAGTIITINVGETLHDYWMPDGTIDNELEITGNGAAAISDNTQCCDIDNSTETSFDVTKRYWRCSLLQFGCRFSGISKSWNDFGG